MMYEPFRVRLATQPEPHPGRQPRRGRPPEPEPEPEVVTLDPEDARQIRRCTPSELFEQVEPAEIQGREEYAHIMSVAASGGAVLRW